MPYSNVKMGSLIHNTSTLATPEIDKNLPYVSDANKNAYVVQIMRVLSDAGVCRATNSAQPVRHGPYSNIKLSDLYKGVKKYFNYYGEPGVNGTSYEIGAASKTAVDEVGDYLIALGLAKDKADTSDRHGPYTNIPLANLIKSWDNNGDHFTPYIRFDNVSTPPDSEVGDLVFVLHQMGICYYNYLVTGTIGNGDSTGGTLVIGGLTVTGDDTAGDVWIAEDAGTITVTITPDTDCEITALSIGGVDSIADVDDPAVGHTFTFESSALTDNTYAISVTFDAVA